MPLDHSCTRCELSQHVKSVCVGYRQVGDPALARKVLVLGEAPGYHEDEHGYPFAGPSGSGEFGIEDVFKEAGIYAFTLDNPVRCWPKERGTPTRAQVKACAPYLDEVLADLKPEFVLTLGNTPLQRIFGKGKISQVAGKEMYSEKHQCWVMPTYHPAFIMRQQGRLQSWKQDIYRFARLIEGKLVAKPPVEVHLVTTIKQLGELGFILASASHIAFDFETVPTVRDWSRDKIVPWWHRDFKAYSLAFSVDGKTSYVLPLNHPDVSPALANLMVTWLAKTKDFWARSECCPTIGHNAGMFDCLVWYRVAGYLPYLAHDTMVETHLLDENRSMRLKWVGPALLGWSNWDIDARLPHPIDELAFYNGCDAAATLLLHRDHFTPALEAIPQLYDYYSKLLMPGLRALQRQVVTGMWADYPEVMRLYKHVSRDLVRVRRAFDSNPGSSKQVAKWLYEDHHLPILKTTPGGAPSTDEETINRLAKRFQEAAQITEYRGYAKNKSTYLRPLLVERIRCSTDDRHHQDIRMEGTETGRLSGFDHTWPRPDPDPEKLNIRGVFSAPPGWRLISGDLCVHPDTSVETLTGPKPISSLQAGEPVYTLRGNKVTWGRVVSSKAVQPLLSFKVTLDNSESVVASGDHKWPVRVRGKRGAPQVVTKRTEELETGDRLVPLKRVISAGRPHLYAYAAIAYSKEQQLVAEAYLGIKPEGHHIHHKNEVSTDNSPVNLEYKPAFDHWSEHGRKSYQRQDHGPRLAALKEALKKRRSYTGGGNPNYGRGQAGNRTCLYCGKQEYRPRIPTCQKYCSRGCYASARKEGFNHRVVSVMPVGYQPMWSIQVDPDHSYALSCGVFTYNSQIETRLVAWLAAGKPRDWSDVNPERARMLAAFAQRRDTYVEFAAMALGKDKRDVTKFERQEMGKVPTLACAYSISPQGLKAYAWKDFEIEWSDAEARQIHTMFYSHWPEIKRWHQYVRLLLETRGWIRTSLGRIRRLPGATNRQTKEAREADIRSGINCDPQTTAWDITNCALVLCDRVAQSKDWMRIVHTVHDSILVEGRSDHVDDAAQLVRDSLLSAPRALQGLGLYLPPGLIECDVTIGRWGDGNLWKQS